MTDLFQQLIQRDVRHQFVLGNFNKLPCSIALFIIEKL